MNEDIQDLSIKYPIDHQPGIIEQSSTLSTRLHVKRYNKRYKRINVELPDPTYIINLVF